MPTIVRDDGIIFVIHTNDHLPAHVHVKLQDGKECRINLMSGKFMDAAPAGMTKKIRESYFRNAGTILAAWEKYHPSES